MKNLIVIMFIVAAVCVARGLLPTKAPCYENTGQDPEAALVDHMLAKVGLALIDWDVHDYVVVKTATGSFGDAEFFFFTTPISFGKWHLLKENQEEQPPG